MRLARTSMIASIVILIGAALIVRGQEPQPVQGTDRPGLATKGRVWIENQGPGEAVPIVATAPIPVIVRPVRAWEYRVTSVTAGVTAAELTRTLTALGAEGWETAGVQVPNGSTTLMVLKRPRIDVR